MNRNEFLRILRESLEMSLEQDAINAQLDYYDKYISDEIKKGRSESDVIKELGDPRLIAKTIKTVNTNSDSLDDFGKTTNDYNRSYEGNSNSQANQNRNYTVYANKVGIGCVIIALVVFIIVMWILRMLGYVAYGLGTLALSGPVGFIIVAAFLFLLFGGRGKSS